MQRAARSSLRVVADSARSGHRWCANSATQQLPTHAVEVEAAGQRKVVLLPVLQGRVDGSGGSGAEAAAAIRAQKPQQVLVELCTSRYGEVLMDTVLGLPPRPPTRLDILGNIHGGLLGHELSPVLGAAREVGAAVTPVDRPRAALRSRVAHGLWHPRLVQGLLRFGAHSLRKRALAKLPVDAEALRKELESNCGAAHEVLVEERATCMAAQIRAAAMPRTQVMVVCGALHCHALAEALRRAPTDGAADEMARLGRRFVPLWPLYAIAYVIIPAAVTGYAFSCAWDSFIAPALDFEDLESSGPQMPMPPPPRQP